MMNKTVAWTVAICAILFSLFVLGGAKLHAEKEAAAAYFYQGENQDGLSIDHDLQQRAAAAYNLYTVASRYLPAENDALRRLLADREALLQAESPADKFRADQELGQSALNVYAALNGMALSEQDQFYRNNLLQQMDSSAATISHDGYNQRAREFNALRQGFPARIIAWLWRIRQLEYFS
ncbi:MAG: LemA family protein [Firmicutes bacterium]|nr:LemA family protein [Bacillota bacterium]